MSLISPGQARALAYALQNARCPGCNRHGSVAATRGLDAGCGHCGRLVTVTAEFASAPTRAGSRWVAEVTLKVAD